MSAAVMLDFASAFVGGVTALIVLASGKRSTASWFFFATLVLLAAESVFGGLTSNAVLYEEAGRRETWSFATMMLVPGVSLLFSLTFARGNYGEFIARWRPVLVAAFVIPIGAAIVSGGRFVSDWHRDPAPDGGDQWLFAMTYAGWFTYLVSLVSAVIVLMQLERTLWTSVGTMRWRIKFSVLGMGVLFAVRAYTASQALVLPIGEIQGRAGGVYGPRSGAAEINSVALLIGCLLMLRSVFRQTTEVTVYPSYSSMHKSVTLLVAGIYLLIVGVFAKAVQWLDLSGSFSARTFLILVAMVGVTALLLSDRARLYARRFVSRYLQRPLYDYRTVWRRFTEGMASRLTEKDLCHASVNLVADLFQALSVSIWLMDDKRQNLDMAASTSLAQNVAQRLRPSADETAAVLTALHGRHDPVDVEYSSEPWAVTLRHCHPSEFAEGGGRVCVPMIAAGELLGVMLVGDRVGGVLFSLQDYDLLKCIGDQVAASLLNSQLSQRLLQAKELEAFQTMSAFFVHDLKNTASTLNLMLKNLPVHFDNPAFREDALRGIAKSGQHINNLIGRLSELRHDLDIKPEPADLNDLVSKILAAWKGSAKVQLTTQLGDVPPFPFDRDQIHKVITNLVINASEAVPADGQIRVETARRDGWAVLTVADNGCGMTPEFLNGALFRPFQTTKKEGFGIGMFQSKMIVEAHGGRVEVESQLNKGTTFRVLLPVNKNTR
jgi:putative PEP-CTERM system histidine kinase